MKGYYQIRIRRAATGAVRQYNFLNHIMPDFYEILMSKTVADNTNSVIDTLVFGDGVGSHAANATVLNGNIVYEKKYNNYQPPTNLSASLAATEFAHTFHFNAFNTEGILQVGEVAIGARIDGIFRIASLTHIKDTNGDPTSMVLMPGDEIDVTWTLIVARPAFLPGYDSVPLDHLKSNLVTYTGNVIHGIDYEMLTAYPNWQLMGIKRILTLIAERNALISKTPWTYQKYNLTSNQWEIIEPTFALLKSGYLQLRTNNTDPNYVAPKQLFIPSILAPVKLWWDNSDAVFGYGIDLKITPEDLYARWKASFRTPRSTITEPQVVNYLNVTYTTTAQEYGVKIHTTPYVLVTVYKNGSVVENLLADEFGICKFNVQRKGLVETDTYTIRAHVNGHQLIQNINFPVPVTDPTNLVTKNNFVQYGGGYYNYPHAVEFHIAPSLIGKVYKAIGKSTLVEGPRSHTPAFETITSTFGDISRTVTWYGEFKVGDIYKVELRDNVTNVLVQTETFEVKSLIEVNERGAKSDPSDQLLLSINVYNAVV